jgi:hypothetical protein
VQAYQLQESQRLKVPLRPNFKRTPQTLLVFNLKLDPVVGSRAGHFFNCAVKLTGKVADQLNTKRILSCFEDFFSESEAEISDLNDETKRLNFLNVDVNFELPLVIPTLLK